MRSSEETCDSTVRTERTSRAAISALLRCSPSSASTSASRADIPGLVTGSLSVAFSVAGTEAARTPAGRGSGHGDPPGPDRVVVTRDPQE
ncbi:hypothetical protein GCM10010216_33660 [Streptomyces flaveolus]|nr:hypothetical protein GCM10010216_33660 [Streptomyces flaveolus]